MVFGGTFWIWFGHGATFRENMALIRQMLFCNVKIQGVFNLGSYEEQFLLLTMWISWLLGALGSSSQDQQWLPSSGQSEYVCELKVCEEHVVLPKQLGKGLSLSACCMFLAGYMCAHMVYQMCEWSGQMLKSALFWIWAADERTKRCDSVIHLNMFSHKK